MKIVAFQSESVRTSVGVHAYLGREYMCTSVGVHVYLGRSTMTIKLL